MSTKAEPDGSPLDTVKWVVALGILVAAVAGFYVYSDQSQLLRVIGLLVAVIVAMAVVWPTPLARTTRGFLADSRVEVRKVVWPTRQETMQTTIAVVVMVIIVGIMLWLMDMFLLWAVKYLTGQGG